MSTKLTTSNTAMSSPLSGAPSLFQEDVSSEDHNLNSPEIKKTSENISPIDINSKLNITDWLIGLILFVGADLVLSVVYGMNSIQFVIIHSLMGLFAAGMGFLYMSRRSQMAITIPAFAAPLIIQVFQSLVVYVTALNASS